jgi:chromosome segregation protein
MSSLKRSSPPLEGRPTEPLQTLKCGATWNRLDLHLHSPGIPAFTPPKGMKREDVSSLAEVYVEQLSAQGISIAAITDYNGINIEWFEVIAAKATNRGITLFPGAEMTFRQGKYAIHVLAIFPGNTDLKEVNIFLQSLDQNPSVPLFNPQGAHRDIDLKIDLTEALKDLRDRFHCLLVLPHPDRTNGLLKSLTAEAAVKLLMEIGLDAIEYCSEKEIKKLKSTDILPESFWDQVAFVEFSNPKRIEEIGTQKRTDGTLQATYLKLSATNLDALRMALHDPETRLSIGSIPSAVHPRIQSLTISGSGFLGNLNISWNQDLNVIIGGKGVGKSAILESLRYAFAIKPYSNPSDREELVHHALGSSGKVEVLLEMPVKEGKTRQYRIARGWGEEPRTYQVSPEKLLPISPSELLGDSGGFSFFGHREIYTISGNEESILALLDELAGDEAHQQAEAVRKAMESLTANAGAILELQAKLAKREEYLQRLNTIDHEIETYQRPVSERLEPVGDFHSMEECLQNAIYVAQCILSDSDQRRSNLLTSLETAQRNFLGVKGKDKALQQESEKVLGVLQESLKVVLDDETTLFEQAIHSLNRLYMRCQESLSPTEGKRKSIGREAPKEPFSKNQLLKFTEEKKSLTSLIAELNGIEDRLKTLRQERKGLLQQVRDDRVLQNKLRKERADVIVKLLNGRLHLQVESKGQKGGYKEKLSLLLKGSNISQETIDRLVLPEATDGIALSEAVRTGSKEVQKHFGLDPETADHLIRWLTAEESRLFELETQIPQDALRLKLRVDGQYRSLDHLPEGQGATAILLLLFSLGNKILVVDQLEDYLDDRFVHEEILQILRKQKGLKDQNQRRQVILTTHDATIPVLGDAELVIPLEARDHHAYIDDQASIDNRSIREFIKTTLQGGKEAFQKRAEKYGGLKTI